MEEVKASYLEFVSCKELFPKTIYEIDNSEFKHHLYCKWQTSDSSWELFSQNRKGAVKLKQLKTILMDNKLRETTYLWVGIMNYKWQVKGQLGRIVPLPLDVDMMLNLSNNKN